jgi:hypothetical protein
MSPLALSSVAFEQISAPVTSVAEANAESPWGSLGGALG